MKGGKEIVITIALHGVTRLFARNFRKDKIEVTAGTTVETLMDDIKLDTSIVGVYQINKENIVTGKYILQPGDHVDIYPLFGGG